MIQCTHQVGRTGFRRGTAIVAPGFCREGGMFQILNQQSRGTTVVIPSMELHWPYVGGRLSYGEDHWLFHEQNNIALCQHQLQS